MIGIVLRFIILLNVCSCINASRQPAQRQNGTSQHILTVSAITDSERHLKP